MCIEATVFVIDPDRAARRGAEGLLRSVRLAVELFGGPREFLDTVDAARPGCVVTEARLPGMSGLELQQRLRGREVAPPVIMVSAHGDIAMAVAAMRNGAVDFLTKPYRPQDLLDRIHEALVMDARVRRAWVEAAALAKRAATLTPREGDVLAHVVAGYPNRVVAAQLGITAKAVEAYRARVMRKMQAFSLAELTRMSVILEQRGLREPLSPWRGQSGHSRSGDQSSRSQRTPRRRSLRSAS